MQREEYGLIGSILIDADIIKDIYPLVKPEAFENELAGECYRVILSLYDIGKTVNIINVSSEMENRIHDKESIQNLLMYCVKDCITSTYAKDYAVAISNDYKTRTAKNIINSVELFGNNVEENIGKIITELEVLQQGKTTNATTISEICDTYQGTFFCEKEENVRTGFYKLDELIGGLDGGNVYVIGARPAVGKSAFSIQMIIQMAQRGKRVGYYNLEMTERQVYARLISQISSLRMDRLRNAKAFLGDEKERFEKATEVIKKMPITVISGKTTLADLKQISRYQEFDVIVIDYLQLLKSERQYSNRASEVGYISKTIKEISLELNVPIILLSQLNRTTDDSKEPTMSELRESGDIEQDASAIMLLWNLTNDRKHKGLKIDKNRDGECGKIAYKFIGENVCFDESSQDFDSYVKSIGVTEKASEELANYNPFR